MNIEQLLSMKSKDEACFILFETDIKPKCVQCRRFWQDEYGSWKCDDSWNEQVCRKEFEFFLQKEMDINTNGKGI